MKKLLLLHLCIFFSLGISNAETKKVLFIGNSYTYVNNLPQMLADVATAMGDTVIFDSNTPGGYTLQGHTTNATTLSKIAVGNWDYVVLQEQSQKPSFPISQVSTDVLPYAKRLDSIIHATNTCAQTVFYTTWGRKNGDAANCAGWPPVCTYAGMDSLLALRYRMMADSNMAILSPVGPVWNKIINTNSNINLYQADESHPSIAGTYAAALTFYSVLFKKDASAITFNAGLSTTDATIIKNATKLVAYDSLAKWNVGKYDAQAQFTVTKMGPLTFSFNNTSIHATSYFWDFGDGNTSNTVNPTHTYLQDGNYTVTLTAFDCKSIAIFKQTFSTVPQSVLENNKHALQIFPNPTLNILQVKGQWRNNNYSILDWNGKIVMQGLLENGKVIDVRNLLQGAYIFTLENKSQLFIKQ